MCGTLLRSVANRIAEWYPRLGLLPPAEEPHDVSPPILPLLRRRSCLPALGPRRGRRQAGDRLGTKIWDKGKHNAFTDLIRWRGKWYCTFREADGHVGGDGKLRVLESADGKTWESVALVAEEGIDLRDPKLSITPDDRLMIVAGGSVYKGTRRSWAGSRASTLLEGRPRPGRRRSGC